MLKLCLSRLHGPNHSCCCVPVHHLPSLHLLEVLGLWRVGCCVCLDITLIILALALSLILLILFFFIIVICYWLVIVVII